MRYLADKSALERLKHPEAAAVLEPLIFEGEVATCGVIELEILYSARNRDDMRRTRASRALAFPRVPMIESDFVRAEEVLDLLAARGQHRTAPLQDLLIAACAERNGLVLIHYDQDFEHIASVTGQSTQWVVPRGTLP